MTDTVAKFWMVYGLKRGTPSYKHYSKADARQEAERLSRSAPGEMFVVLAAVDAVVSPILDPQTVKLTKPKREEDDGIPF